MLVLNGLYFNIFGISVNGFLDADHPFFLLVLRHQMHCNLFVTKTHISLQELRTTPNATKAINI